MRVAAAATLLLATTSWAQAPWTCEVHVAADPARVGPEAWTWLRDGTLRSLAESAPADLTRALRITWSPDGLVVTATEDEPDAYLFAELRRGPRRVATVTTDWNGAATWHVHDADATPPRARTLANALGLHRPEPHAFDVAVLAAHLAPIPHDDGALADLLTVGASRCGTVRFVRTGETWSGQSGGGLLLPAAITLLAELSTHPEHGWDVPRTVPEEEGWRLLAFAARHGARAEAIAQLARLGDVETLERILHASRSTLRASAMESLIRAGAANSLDRVVDAAREDTLTTGLARAAVANLWPAADRATRHRTDEAYRPRRPAELPAEGGWSTFRTIALWLLAGSFVILLASYVKLTSRTVT